MIIRITFLILFLSFTPVFTGAGLFSQTKELKILHWNDLHAHNQPDKQSKKDKVTGENIFYYTGGTSGVLGYINKQKNSATLVLNGGDDFQGTPISNITRGGSQIELMNLINPDAMTIGNHEFDYSDRNLDSVLQFAKFDYLSCNVFYKPKNSTMGKRYVIKEVNGIKIGIIGVTTKGLFSVSIPKNLENIILLNTDSAIASAIKEVKKKNCDLVILLTHCGVEDDKYYAQLFHKDVDVIVGGHSHTALFKLVIQDGVVIVQAGSYARWLGEVDLQVDVDKDTVVSYSAHLIETILDSSINDKTAQLKVDEMTAGIAPEMNRVIAVLEKDWTNQHGQESNLGQFEADAFRKKTNSDVAFINAGGLREKLSKGNITVEDIWKINPFGNELVILNVTGSRLIEMINDNVKVTLERRKIGEGVDFLNVSGITYTYNSKKADGNYLTEIKINGETIDENKTYRICMSNYVESQDEKFFGRVKTPEEKSKIEMTGLIDRDVILEALEKAKVISGDLIPRVIEVK